MSDDTIIQTLHPDPSKKGVRINGAKYAAIRTAILEVLQARGEMTFNELGLAVENQVMPDFDGSVMWYYTTVKLDLEARGEVQRVPASNPQRIRLVERIP